MLKIKVENDKIKMQNDIGTTLLFPLSQKHTFNVIKNHIEYIDKEGCEFSIEKKGVGECYLILRNNYKILISELTAYEISNRMQLLNQRLKMPSDNVVEASNEEEETERTIE